jgi:hypothetical protein
MIRIRGITAVSAVVAARWRAHEPSQALALTRPRAYLSAQHLPQRQFATLEERRSR